MRIRCLQNSLGHNIPLLALPILVHDAQGMMEPTPVCDGLKSVVGEGNDLVLVIEITVECLWVPKKTYPQNKDSCPCYSSNLTIRLPTQLLVLVGNLESGTAEGMQVYSLNLSRPNSNWVLMHDGREGPSVRRFSTVCEHKVSCIFPDHKLRTLPCLRDFGLVSADKSMVCVH